MRQVILNNKPFYVHDCEDLSNHIVREQDFYEREILDYLDQFNYDTFIDVGANIGNHSRWFSDKGCEVWAFEPYWPNFELLKKNCPDAKCFNIAAGSNIELVDMCPDHTNLGMTTTVSGSSVLSIALDHILFPTLPLDKEVLLKIDVEGDEDFVLDGLQDFLYSHPKIDILIETKYPVHLRENCLVSWKLVKSFPHNNHFFIPKHD